MDGPSPSSPDPALIARFTAIVGAANALTDPHDQEPYLIEWRDRYRGTTPLVLKPGSTAEVAAILKLANETQTAIVPQGGNTGLVGGQIPFAGAGEVVVSLSRMNTIRALDPDGNTMIVDAGTVLQRIQEAAEAADRMFPLSLGSEGTCQIGGNLSTNAGGTAVLAYGNTRDLVLGLEVVLADGRIWNGLKTLRKDNTGYDLKNLFIGAEGTLGIITAAALKLFPKPRAVATAFVAVDNPHKALALLALAQTRSGDRLTSFELMPRIGVDFAISHLADARDPLATPHPWYALIELSSGDDQAALDSTLEGLLSEAYEGALVRDAALAASSIQAQAFWHVRLGMSEVQRHEGGSIKNDIAVPVSSVPMFLDDAMAAMEAAIPGCRPVPFGHLGDGNIHFNITQPEGADKDAFLARWDDITGIVNDLVRQYQGSVSAEHGIGRMKRSVMPAIKDPVELDMMRQIKGLLDPNGILNPGKVL